MPDYFEPVSLSYPDIESLKEKAHLADSYTFLDANVVLRSDSEDILRFFRETYVHFVSPSEQNVADPHSPQGGMDPHSYFVLSEVSAAGGPLLIWDGNRACTLAAGNALPDSADVIVFSSVLSKIKSHFLIHGASLASGGGAVVLSGLTGSGKSTLTLELVRRGLEFGSDEIAAISRETHLVHPFPRAIGSRENTLKLLEGIDLASGRIRHTTSGEKKWMVDIEDIFGASLLSACPGRYVLLLETHLGDDGKPDKTYHTIHVALKREESAFIDRLNDIEGVDHLGAGFDGRVHIAKFRVRKDKVSQRAFLDGCRDYDDLVLYRVKSVENPPDPGVEPKLFPMPAMEAALELFGNLQNLVPVDGSMPKGKDVSRIVFELADAMSDMACYRVLVGNLEKTANLVCDLVAG